jgi:hypothetical protein
MSNKISLDEDYGQKQRRIDKKKHHSRGFNEEALDQRAQRINFKNYIRQVREEEYSSEAGEEWVVERGVKFDEDVQWTEIASFLSEQEAEDHADEQREFDTYGDEYRVRRA